MENPIENQPQALKIFLVDDDIKILDLFSKVLRKAGYFTMAGTSAVQALEMIERGLTKVDLIITDLNMPGLNGIDFYHKVKERRPDLTNKIIFITGGVGPGEMAEELDRLPNPKLKKPLAADELLKTVALIASGK